ncbi:hypothetical protein O1R50_03335 [Glycomyces luteolus]|uniref:Uncharacterized protein n=1 Tax=Glycomyces luteolus TaxID=2670330 RepID=A0A9X3P4P5_9ACTN|nr:hypothetical protein [Glycomyces luteolus]MDA1358638.1 hypothetical protein [Glycomyces luteolus]
MKTAEPSDPLLRGRFTDGYTDFSVRASSADMPDSFQVYVSGNHADLVLIVSGLISGYRHATWGDGWRAYTPEWKAWAEDTAFKVFSGGRVEPTSKRAGSVRFCDG